MKPESIRTGVAIVGLIAAAGTSGQESTEVVEVVAQTPLGAGIDLDRVAANVQRVSGETIRSQGLLDLSQFMGRNLGSVFINEAQSNPLQPDLQYRGFVGSPLLGLPQGLAVYMDGVRLNEPFGDTVNWALLPDSAVATMTVMPGSNPLFGLNALGGAISIRTRDGFSDPGTVFNASTGSFGRSRLTATTGAATDGFGYFVTAQFLEEDGWRDFSPTDSTQLFGKLGWRLDRTAFDVAIGIAETDLIGNGPAPVQLLAIDRASVFTRPDITENSLRLVNASVEHELSDRLSLSGNVHFRSSDIDSLNGDDSEFEECEDLPGFLCEGDDGSEEIIIGTDDLPIMADASLEGATVNRTQTQQASAGFGLQGNLSSELMGFANELVFGAVYDDSSIEFVSSTELGMLDATRFAVPGGVFLGEAFTELDADTSTLGLYFANTLALTDFLTISVSGRFNDTDVVLRDRLGTALNGDHGFSRFNPAVGVTAALSDTVTIYASFSESARAPSPVELTCADPDDPCRLPNAFLADPPLEQVVARTLETGLRGTVNDVVWHVGMFRTTNLDDIIFVSAGALTNQGFFANIGKTRRDGVEINMSGEFEQVSWFVNYSFLDAMFRQNLLLPSANNPGALAGEILVQTGDQLPLLPRHSLKAGAQRAFGSRLTLGANIGASSGFHLRGDEGNNLAEIGRHAVLNLFADYRLSEQLRLTLNIDNLFDRDYETFGLFGEPDEVLGDEFGDPRFLSPAAPRAAWFGVEYRLH